MPTTKASSPRASNHPDAVDLASSRFLVRWFRSALLEVGGATKAGRAHGRFDEIARHDADLRQPWVGYSIEMCRAQMYAACEEGPDAKAETRRRIERAGAEFVRACLSGFVEDPGTAPTLPTVSLEFTKDATEAIVAVQTARETGSESDAERARREVQDVAAAAPRVLELLGQAMASARSRVRVAGR